MILINIKAIEFLVWQNLLKDSSLLPDGFRGELCQIFKEMTTIIHTVFQKLKETLSKSFSPTLCNNYTGTTEKGIYLRSGRQEY